MLIVFIIVFCAIVALGFGAASAWSDFSRMTIPNVYAAFIGAAFIPAFLSAYFFAADASFFDTWKSHLLAGCLVFIVTYLLFYFKFIGGGDSKLLSVYALWVGMSGLMPLFFFMAVIGGALGLGTLALRRWKPVERPMKDSWIDKSQQGKEQVPYGIAIFVGALAAFWASGYLNIGSLVDLASIRMGS